MPYGQNGTLAISFQNSYGASNTASPYFFPITGESVTLKKEDLVSGEMRGIYDEGGSYEGKNTVDGDITADVDMISIGVMAKAAFGAASVVTSGTLKTHTFKPRTTDFDTHAAGLPFTLIKDLDDPGSAQVYYDMVASGIEFAFSNGELHAATLNIVGGKYSHIAPLTPSFKDAPKWSWDTTSFSLSDTGVSDLLDVTISVNEAIEPYFTINASKFPSHIKRTGVRTVEVSGTLMFNDQTEFNKFKSQSEQRMVLTAVNSSVTVQSGYNERITIDIPSLRYTSFEPSLSGAGQIEASFTAKAKYNTGSATAIAVTLQNSHGAY